VALGSATLDAPARTWVVAQLALNLPADDASAAEPLALAACALAAKDASVLRRFAQELHATDGVPHARALLVVTRALGELTARDAGHAATAALLAGQLDAAAAIRPASRHDLANRGWLLTQHQVALVRATDGSAAIAPLLDAVAEIHRSIDQDDTEALLDAAGITEAYAHVRAGHHANAVKRYGPFKKRHELMRPWHLLALGDALEATGDLASATEQWKLVAYRAAWEPYWPERARERLAKERVPYR
jgi:hypothetical protein